MRWIEIQLGLNRIQLDWQTEHTDKERQQLCGYFLTFILNRFLESTILFVRRCIIRNIYVSNTSLNTKLNQLIKISLPLRACRRRIILCGTAGRGKRTIPPRRRLPKITIFVIDFISSRSTILWCLRKWWTWNLIMLQSVLSLFVAIWLSVS